MAQSTLPTCFRGPLPKSDSVQSLVSFMACSPVPALTPPLDDPTIRGVDADGQTHAHPIDPDTHSISLSDLSLHTVSLGALSSSPSSSNLRQISLAANAIDTIDLTPLSWCTNLVVLALNSNRLSLVDLTPLSSCKLLERLWLHDNKLESIDLSPLASCHSLRSLYLEDNSIHHNTIDLDVLYLTTNLRSLRLGGNKLAGKLNITPLLQCLSLSVFHIDTTVKLLAKGDAKQARVSPALRRVLTDITFVSPDSDSPVQPSTTALSPISTPKPRPQRGRTNPPVSPRPHSLPTNRRPHVRTPQSPPISPKPSSSSSSSSPPSSSPTASSNIIVKVLLVGFRRLARYAAEDSLARCGKLIIRASDQAVATKEPALLLDSHLILLYAPPEKTLRQISLVAARTPTAVIASERYKNTADSKLRDCLASVCFYNDPMQVEDAKHLYNLATCHAVGENPQQPNRSPSFASPPPTPAISDERESTQQCSLTESSSHRPFLDGDPSSPCRPVIELEDIDDDGESREFAFHDSNQPPAEAKIQKVKIVGISELLGRLNDRRNHRSRSGRLCSEFNKDLSMHNQNKLRSERVAVENALRDLGGYATLDTCSGIARACGLAKCAGPLLFRAAFGSSCEVEAMTPEAGVPNAPIERMKRISSEAFLAYWDSRLRVHDGEERLVRILEDSHAMRINGAMSSEDVGHSEFGARPSPCRTPNNGRSLSLDGLKLRSLESVPSGRLFGRGSSADLSTILPTDVCCPCDAGIEDLIRSFMESRSSRFGTYALVKMAEAIAVGAALVIHEIRACSSNRVGGQARPVCPKEVKESKLNAALMAAEVGIFEGVASGLSMTHIRSVKGCFATEITPTAFSQSAACALSVCLSVEEVQHFCVSRKTLLPGAAKRVMYIHCRNASRMSLSEFSILLHILNDITTDGAMDYFFAVVDVDQNDEWTLPDLREFHREKECLWNEDGMAVNDLNDVWFNLVDMVGNRFGTSNRKGITRKQLLSLGAKDRKSVLQNLLFVDDDCSSLNIRRTMELSKNNKSNLEVVV